MSFQIKKREPKLYWCFVQAPSIEASAVGGGGSVDFVLVWSSSSNKNVPDAAAVEDSAAEVLVESGGGGDTGDHKNNACKLARARRIFEANLELEGLVLEYEPPESNGLNFVKITAPLTVLKRYAEILKLRLPMKKVSKNIYCTYEVTIKEGQVEDFCTEGKL